MDINEKNIITIQEDASKIVSANNSLKTFHFFGKILNLTSKEFDILQLMVESPGNIFSRKALLEKVWGYNYYGDTRAVDNQIRRLRKKIEPDPSNPKYILTKWGDGYFYKESI